MNVKKKRAFAPRRIHCGCNFDANGIAGGNFTTQGFQSGYIQRS